MTEAPERICYVNCGLSGMACACFRAMYANQPIRADLFATDEQALSNEKVKALVEASKRLEKARDAMRRIYTALTTTQAHVAIVQKELDSAWADFDTTLAALEPSAKKTNEPS